MATPSTLNGNGHRRREVRKRVLAEETHCALCDELVDKTLTMSPGEHGRKCTDPTCTGCVPHPRKAEVDEDVPRIRGGSAYDRANCHLMHRDCNRRKGQLTLAEARASMQTRTIETPPIAASAGW